MEKIEWPALANPCNVLRALAMAEYNLPFEELFEWGYGHPPQGDSYYDEKSALFRRRGIVSWASTLDTGNAERFMAKVMERYGDA